MDATQMITDSILESDEDENEEENEEKRERPLAKLCILKNEHIPETELPLFLGDNVLGRDPNTCTLPLPAPSISKQHATICISVYRGRGRHSEEDIEALVWDLGSMNGTRKGRLKLTPNVRYALSESDSLVVADIPCQYVSCAVEGVSSQGDKRTQGSRNSGVARLPDASGEKGSDKSTGSKKCVNGGTKARVLSPVLEDTKKTPVGASCLSFEQTPTQPQGTLVPESDSDSDGERGVGGDWRRKALVTDSDGHKSSPICSTFLTPTNKIVPESEDESPITPSLNAKRPYRHVSFSKEETDVDVGRQQLKEKKALAIVDDSEEEGGREEERAALGGRKSEESGQHVPVKQEGDVSLTGEDESSVSIPAVFTDAIPAFNMDSDTDLEGEEEGVVSVGPVTLKTNQQADQPPNTAQFYMDSDTDVDEDDDASDKVPKSAPSSADNTKPPCAISVIQPEGITMDSDTDVDDDAAVSDTVTKAKPTSFQSTHTADSAPSTQPKDFHLDSDTDVDEEEEKECGTDNTCSKTDETPIRLDIKPVGTESGSAAPHSLCLDSNTDDKAITPPAISEPVVVSAVTESRTTADTGADLGILSDSDTDVEDDSPLIIPVVVTNLSVAPGTLPEAFQSDSGADTDVDESSMPPAGEGVNAAKFSVDSDTDVEDKGLDFGEEGEGLRRENTPAPLLQNCSTPVQLSVLEGNMEDMDTQAFLSPSSGPFKCTVSPTVRSQDSQGDEDFVVAETQSFVLQTRDSQGNPLEDHTMDPTQAFGLESSGDDKSQQFSKGGSFRLGLSESSHLQGPAEAVAMESTQAFASVEGGVTPEDTQAYAAISNADRTSLENDSNLESTQAYGENEQPARCSVMSEREDQVDLALEATQAYISALHSDSEGETNEDEGKNTATAETQPLDVPTSSSLAIAETQPTSAFKEKESLDKNNPVSSVLQVKPKPQNEMEEREEQGEAAQSPDRHLSKAFSVVETQPMRRSDDEESSDEDSIPCLRKRKAKPLQLEEEQTQPLSSSELSLVETQPMHIGVDETQPMATSGNEESDAGDSIPGPRKRKEKQQWLEVEETQTLTNSLSAVETQPMDTGEHGESDEEDSIIGPRKRKAKPLQLEEEQTQSLTISDVSAVETQPMGTCEEQSDEEDSIPGPRKRKAKQLWLEEEVTQTLTNSELSAVETQPMVKGDESDEEDSIPGPRKRKAKPLLIQEEETQSLTNSEASTVETQCLETKAGSQPQRGKGRQSEAGTSSITIRGRRGSRALLREEEEQAECSEPPKRQTRGKNKALPTTRGRRGKTRPDGDESEEEEEVEQAKQARGKKSIRQQKDNEEEEGMEKNKHADRSSELKEQERETMQKEKRELDETERKREESQHMREEQNKLERERKEKEEQQRLQAENAERLRLDQERVEKERIERERKEQEEKERADRTQREKEEQLERERREKEEKDRLECEKAEREEKERLEREEKERIEKERKEREETARLEAAKREQEERLEKERKEQEQQARLEREAKEREEREKLEREKHEKEAKEKQINEQEENKPKTPARGRRAARTIAAPCTVQPEDSSISTIDDVPARRTRSRSNSSNSVSSERSASSVNTQQSRGRGRGRGAKRTSEPPQAAVARSSNRRRTAAAGPTEQDSNDISPQGVRSRSNSTNSNSEISSCSLSSQSRGRGGRQRGRGRRTEAEPHSIPAVDDLSDQKSAPKPAARGRKSRKAEESSNEVPHEGDEEKADSQQASTTRGRRRANANRSESAAVDEEDLSNKGKACASEDSLLSKRNVRGRGQKAVEAVAPAVRDGDEAKEKRNGRKRELEANAEEDSSSSSNISKVAQTTKGAEEEEEGAKGETRDEIPVQAKRRGRASSAQAKKNVKPSPTEVEVKEESEQMKEEAVERKGRGRPSVVQKKKKAEGEESGTSVDQDAHVEASEPQTPTSSASRKRQAPADSSPVAKTPRSSSASPAASGRLRAASQAYKVLFTGVVDEAGERVLARLGGGMAKGVADMNCLVTDKVRRTVKFLCAVAKGVPIVTTHWLEKSGKAGSFLSPNAFVVKDPEQEKKFNFCLQESLRIASSQPLLHGYEIHVTKSVKPDPAQMKDIISCSGATFLPKMPSSHKPLTVVISCEEDWLLCGPALAASLPVVTAEFVLTGILQQKLDLQIHSLSASASNPQSAGGRGRGRKKT